MRQWLQRLRLPLLPPLPLLKLLQSPMRRAAPAIAPAVVPLILLFLL
jgi:hypothetical protein